MDRLKYAIIGMATIISSMIYTMTNPWITKAQEKCLSVDIYSPSRIEPKVLNIAKGDCVLWIHRSVGDNVRIVFSEGPKCVSMTESPFRFRMDLNGCYSTDYLCFGCTSSLVFTKTGKFDYEVEFSRADKEPSKATGSIIVK